MNNGVFFIFKELKYRIVWKSILKRAVNIPQYWKYRKPGMFFNCNGKICSILWNESFNIIVIVIFFSVHCSEKLSLGVIIIKISYWIDVWIIVIIMKLKFCKRKKMFEVYTLVTTLILEYYWNLWSSCLVISLQRLRHLKLMYFYVVSDLLESFLIFLCNCYLSSPRPTFGSFLRGQSHSPNVNLCIILFSIWRSSGAL